MFQWNEIAKQLKTQPLHSVRDIDAFLDRAGAMGPTQLQKLLAAVVDLEPKSQPDAHAMRCELFVAAIKRAPSPELFSPCMKALKHADVTLREAIVSIAPLINHIPAHAELVDLLASPESPVRGVAVELIKQIGGPTALEIATKRAADPGFAGRADAVAAFIGRAGSHSLPLLTAVVRVGRAQEKIIALRCLDRTRFARQLDAAIALAVETLGEPEDLVVAQAITALGQLEDPAFWEHAEPALEGRGVEVARAFLVFGAKQPSDVAAALFRDRFRQGPKAIRLVIIEAIESAGSEPLYPTLIEALSHRDVAIRTRAAHAVAELSRRESIDAARAIVWLLRSSQVNVRRVAAEIANQVGDRDGTLAPKLLQYLRDEDWWVRERVLDALVELDTAAITKHVIKDYLSDASGVVRRFAVSALMRIGDRRALGALVRVAQSDEDWFVAELAVEAVGRLGDERATAYLVDLLTRRPEIRVACIGALRQLKSNEALPDVAELAQDPDPDVRAAALTMLEELDDGTFALWAKSCEDDTSPTVREAAGRLLRRFRMQRGNNEPIVAVRSLDGLLSHAVREDADDLFIMAGQVPYVKSRGLIAALGSTTLSDEQIRDLLRPHFSPAHREAFEAGREVDFSYDLALRGLRFRVNVFRQMTGTAAVFRTVKNDMRSLADLQVPKIMQSFAEFPHGLVLVGGPTGAGKSTTLAALVDHINRSQSRHIVTIEDPIEVVHRRQKSLVTQREVGAHTHSFRGALKSALRQDPDVILVGELRDLDTIAFAVTAAETGHLVFGTVHTTSADATVDRLIHAFPAKQQPQVRGMLAESLRAVTCQHLVLTPEGTRRPVVEIMIKNEAIESLIRKGKNFQIPTVIGTSRDQGMQLMDAELTRLAKDRAIVLEEAYARVIDKSAFEAALGIDTGKDDPADGRQADAGGRR